MARSLIDILYNINERIGKLARLNEDLNEKIKLLETENENLKLDLKEKEAELTKAELDIEFLKMSYKLAESPDMIVSARARIARLIKDIDNCISMLKQE